MIVITGGGTGGHLVIAKAIKEELCKKGIKPLYIGSQAGQDKQWFEQDHDFAQKYFLESRGVVNKRGFKKLFTLVQIIKLAFTCKALLKQHRIRAVFSVGGYSAAPASFGALLAGIPLYIHEQNAVTGKLNALLKPFAKAFFSSYDLKAIVCDYPIRELFFEHQRIRKEFKTIIFLGGSQGATFINNLAMQLAPLLHQKGIKIIHQTGAKDFSSLLEFYTKASIPADVFDFSTTMPQKIYEADIAISRAGASTLWELCASAIPTLFIPFPHAAANHQFFNAKTLVDKGLALLESQRPMESHYLLERLEKLPLQEISEKLSSTIHAGGAKTIADYLLSHLKES